MQYAHKVIAHTSIIVKLSVERGDNVSANVAMMLMMNETAHHRTEMRTPRPVIICENEGKRRLHYWRIAQQPDEVLSEAGN